MHPLKPEFDLSKLRRQLEEVLAMLNADHNGAAFNRSENEVVLLSVHPGDDTIAAEPDGALANDHREPETPCEPVLREVGQRDERDDLYDDALVVVTEFGQASPAVLQMWLSIDYGRATTILTRFQADGLISSKGKVRHKAFSLRRSLEQQQV
ncbi:MAG TPA: DNA translocase FtsK [Blastocatellia bacterium]|nr:DNA translocase FtsK [Blastocatellia bacterium]